MACDNRQLTEAQRQAGYQNQRTGVQQAVRPFSGRPTLDNLIDYINRELQPAVRRTRDAVNDVYLQVADNAPSGNPLAYYFSTETGAADPTVGRIRLNASPQDTATTIRISQTNARLVDVAPWLDVMAGSSTTPLGVVTLSDAINPGRAIRFDLSTMADQGAYWDLGVSVIESTHDDPFVEGEAVVLAFIPGVASTGTTVPPGALTPIGPNTVLGNPTASTAAPTEIPLNPLSVLGRQGITGTGNVESIDVPDTSVLTGESVFLRATSARTNLRFRNFTLQDLPEIGHLKFIGNVSGATSRPIYTDIVQLAQDLFGIGFDTATHNFRLSDASDNTFLGNISGAVTHPQPTPLGDLSSTSIIYENVGKTFIRQTMDGDVFADQNSNVTLIQPNVVSDTKLRDSVALSVIGRAFNSTGDPADISAVAASGAVLRESGSTLGFGTIATAGLADDSATNAKLAEMAANTVKANATSSTANPTDFAVGTNTVLGRVAADIVSAQLVNAQITDATIANAKLANMTAGTVKGLQTDASTGAPADLTGLEVGELLRVGTRQSLSLTTTTNDFALNADTNVLRVTPTGTQTLSGMTGGTDGRIVLIENIAATGNVVSLPSLDTGSLTANRFRTPNGTPIALRFRETVVARWDANSGDWRIIASGRATIVADADYGDITVSASGLTWTIDNDVVSDAKLRNSAALSVIGRSANSTGDPADIAAANDAEVLRRSGTTLGFGTIATAGIADDAVTDAKLRNSGALSVIGRSANSSGDPADISAVAASDAVLRESGSVLGFGTIATGGIANNAVTDTKLRDSAAVSVIGRSANSSGDPADIAAAANDRLLARTSDSLAFQQLTVGMVTDGILTNAKLANMAGATVKGRQVDAGTGAPADLTGLEVAELFRLGTTQAETLAATTNNLTLNADTNVLRITPSGSQTLTGMTGGDQGRLVCIENIAGSGNNLTLASLSASSTAANRFRTPAAVDLVLAFRESCLARWETNNGDWRIVAIGRVGAADRDYGDITVSGAGLVWTIDNDVVSDAKLRNSTALSVIGRSANSTGDPADIATTSGSNGVLVESSGNLAWGLITTNNILDNTIANADLRQSAALSVVGRTFNTIGNVADISAVAASDAVLRESGSTLAFGQIATAGIADDAVTNAKLRNGGALSVIGRSANSTGDVADIAGTASSDQVLRVSGTTLGFGTVATAGIADAAVTLAKQADLAQSRIIGRAEGAGTGVPTALTPTQVVAIIDGETVTWTGSHTFNGTNFTVTAGADITLTASGGTTTLAATTQVQITSPTTLASSVALTSIGTTNVTAADNLVINSVSVVRFTGPANPLTGMVPVVDGQVVLLVNAHATDDLVIQLEATGSSTAANCFSGDGTDRHVKPGEMALAWYDGNDDRWRLLCRDEVDL